MSFEPRPHTFSLRNKGISVSVDQMFLNKLQIFQVYTKFYLTRWLIHNRLVTSKWEIILKQEDEITWYESIHLRDLFRIRKKKIFLLKPINMWLKHIALHAKNQKSRRHVEKALDKINKHQIQ